MLKYDGMAPRYTSYPPAPIFKAEFPRETVSDWLRALAPGQNLSLYLHIPFCAKLCYYCGCNTSIANDYDRVSAYLQILRREIDTAAALVDKGVIVTQIHFGGGSPTMMADADFTALMDRLRTAFTLAPDAEIAIEADPRQLTRGRIDTYVRAGVTRLSLGTQDFEPEVLAAVNREQPYELTENAIKWAREAGIKSVNMDIMYGLPFQTVASITRTLERVAALSPERVAFFGYAHVPWMKKHMGVIGEQNLPDAGLRYDLFEAGKSILVQAGYRAIGIDHFVRPGDAMHAAWKEGRLNRNFQGYTTDSAQALLGLGASAISAFPQGYAQNLTDQRAYADAVESGLLPVARGLAKTPDDVVRGEIIMRLMCDFFVDLHAMAQRNDLPTRHFDDNVAKLAPLIADHLVDFDGRGLRINPAAPQIARIAAQAFDAYAAPSAESLKPRHSRAV